MRMDFDRTKLIGTATVDAFHGPLEWAGIRDEASTICVVTGSTLRYAVCSVEWDHAKGNAL